MASKRPRNLSLQRVCHLTGREMRDDDEVSGRPSPEDEIADLRVELARVRAMLAAVEGQRDEAIAQNAHLRATCTLQHEAMLSGELEGPPAVLGFDSAIEEEASNRSVIVAYLQGDRP